MSSHPPPGPPTPEEVRRAAEVLERLIAHPDALVRLSEEDCRRLVEAAGRAARPSKDERRKRARAFRRKDRDDARAHDAAVLGASALRKQKSLSFYLPKAIGDLLGVEPPLIGEGAPEGDGPATRDAARLLRVQGALRLGARVLSLDVPGLRGAELREAGAIRN